MKNLLVVLLLLPVLGKAQSKLTGLGNWTIGITTPDSVSQSGFKEQEQSVVKGTLALPCDHIRVFTSAQAEVAGVIVTNLTLFFYDNKLFRIACAYDGELKKVFQSAYGAGTTMPAMTFQLCAKENKSTSAAGESWVNGDVLALAVYQKGYNEDCNQQEGATLTIIGKEVSDLSSACDLRNSDPVTEEYLEALKD